MCCDNAPGTEFWSYLVSATCACLALFKTVPLQSDQQEDYTALCQNAKHLSAAASSVVFTPHLPAGGSSGHLSRPILAASASPCNINADAGGIGLLRSLSIKLPPAGK